MKKEQGSMRTKWLTIRLTEEEYSQLEKLAAKTLCPSLSDYGRSVLLKRPVDIRTRNQSLDDFLADMLVLRRELNAIETNFNQAVYRLHTVISCPEIHHWILINERTRTNSSGSSKPFPTK